MDASSDIKDRLQRLRIQKESRPAAEARAPARRGNGWVYAVVAAAGGGVAVFAFRDGISSFVRDRFADAAEVRLVTAAPRRAGAGAVLTATGKIVSDHLVQVATKVSGQITDLMFEQGDVLEQGQIIARVEETNYRARRDNAAAVLAQSKARLEYARANYERVRKLFEDNHAGEIELVNMKSEFDAAASRVDADEAVLREAQWRLDECAVKAPISGVVLTRNVEVGDFVAAEGGFGGFANSQFATVADTAKLRVEVDISESDIAKLRPDMRCRITPDAYRDRHYDGHVMWLDPGANYSKATVQVKVRIESPDAFLRVDGSARVDFLADADGADGAGDSGSIWVPRSAVAAKDGTKRGAVFVCRDGVLHRTDVTIGRRTDREIEIISGLTGGERIAAGPVEDLSDEQRVREAGD